ncbi:hypothetical protein SOVF_146650 [Spinacia oleracea]|nr:hypothetical protein SOVF_146650 [Spinacia oleracea]
MKYVEGACEDDNEFKRLFLMLSLDSVLTPTKCHRLSMKFFHCVVVAHEASEYGWCSLVLEKFLHDVGSFSKRFYADGYARGYGCLIFLAIFYLDRLKRPPADWGVFSRMMVWTIEEMNKAQNLDCLPSRDYGCVGCVDVAYGPTHPMMKGIMPGKRITSTELDKLMNAAKAGLDTNDEDEYDVSVLINVTGKRKRRRGGTSKCIPQKVKGKSTSQEAQPDIPPERIRIIEKTILTKQYTRKNKRTCELAQNGTNQSDEALHLDVSA